MSATAYAPADVERLAAPAPSLLPRTGVLTEVGQNGT